VIKLDIDTIDEGLLTAKETKIGDLKKEKNKLEERLMNILDKYNIAISDKVHLNQKVQMF
jgi:hypothetical protein